MSREIIERGISRLLKEKNTYPRDHDDEMTNGASK
jgi:hypothetical protein